MYFFFKKGSDFIIYKEKICTKCEKAYQPSSSTQQWRKSVFKRDKYTCQSCGDNRGGNLRAHHIKEYAKFPKLRHVVNNGITLCETCHIKVHSNIELDIQSELAI